MIESIKLTDLINNDNIDTIQNEDNDIVFSENYLDLMNNSMNIAQEESILINNLSIDNIIITEAIDIKKVGHAICEFFKKVIKFLIQLSVFISNIVLLPFNFLAFLIKTKKLKESLTIALSMIVTRPIYVGLEFDSMTIKNFDFSEAVNNHNTTSKIYAKCELYKNLYDIAVFAFAQHRMKDWDQEDFDKWFTDWSAKWEPFGNTNTNTTNNTNNNTIDIVDSQNKRGIYNTKYTIDSHDEEKIQNQINIEDLKIMKDFITKMESTKGTIEDTDRNAKKIMLKLNNFSSSIEHDQSIVDNLPLKVKSLLVNYLKSLRYEYTQTSKNISKYSETQRNLLRRIYSVIHSIDSTQESTNLF